MVTLLCRLQMFADRLVDRFVASGMMLHEYDHVKLHITVMNSLMRKDLSNAIVSEDSRTATRTGTKDRESFDATRVIEVIFVAVFYVGCKWRIMDDVMVAGIFYLPFVDLRACCLHSMKQYKVFTLDGIDLVNCLAQSFMLNVSHYFASSILKPILSFCSDCMRGLMGFNNGTNKIVPSRQLCRMW